MSSSLVNAPQQESEPPPAHAAVAGPWALYGLLLCSVIASVAVQGTMAPSLAHEVLVNALLGTTLLLAFLVGGLPRRVIAAAAVAAVAGALVPVVRDAAGASGDGQARVLSALLVALAPPAVGRGVIRNLQSSGEVRVEAVMGVLSLYMLLGMLFAFVFGAIDRFGSQPFFADDAEATVARCLYFSFVTLTTTGYGDLTAQTDLGHMLSVFEALTGQIYLVTVVSLIVSNLAPRERRRRVRERDRA